jgi:hypothetical protein
MAGPESARQTMRRPVRAAGAASHYDDMYDDIPLSQLLLRYLWPFWLFKDASRGDRVARAAAYRHNRSMRIHLPGYLARWLIGSALALVSTAGFGAMSDAGAGKPDVFAVIAAGWGIVFACSVCVLFVTSYIYLYLSRNDV